MPTKHEQEIAELKAKNAMLQDFIQAWIIENQSDSIWQEEWYNMRDRAKSVMSMADAIGKLSKGATILLPSRS